ASAAMARIGSDPVQLHRRRLLVGDLGLDLLPFVPRLADELPPRMRLHSKLRCAANRHRTLCHVVTRCDVDGPEVHGNFTVEEGRTVCTGLAVGVAAATAGARRLGQAADALVTDASPLPEVHRGADGAALMDKVGQTLGVVPWPTVRDGAGRFGGCGGGGPARG